MRGISGKIRMGSISRRWAKLKVLNQSTQGGFPQEELSPCQPMLRHQVREGPIKGEAEVRWVGVPPVYARHSCIGRP